MLGQGALRFFQGESGAGDALQEMRQFLRGVLFRRRLPGLGEDDVIRFPVPGKRQVRGEARNGEDEPYHEGERTAGPTKPSCWKGFGIHHGLQGNNLSCAQGAGWLRAAES